MRRHRRFVQEEQLRLFERPKMRPRWKQFPAEVREEAIRLLTLMLRGHVARGGRLGGKGGVSDE